MTVVFQLSLLQLQPSKIPDLSSECPVIISGRYHGNFPDSLKVSGILADTSNFSTELKVEKTKDIPLDKVISFIFLSWYSLDRQLSLL